MMNIKIRVYRYEETLEEQYSDFEEAKKAFVRIQQKDPDLLLEPYVELGDSCEISIYELKSLESSLELDSDDGFHIFIFIIIKDDHWIPNGCILPFTIYIAVQYRIPRIFVPFLLLKYRNRTNRRM